MKKFTKVLAVLMAVCLLASVAVIPASAVAEYKAPKVTAGQFTERPKIDGVLDENCWKYATAVELTKAKLLNGEGHLWSPTGGETTDASSFPDKDGEGWALFGWDKDYFYFALEVYDTKNTNTESLGDNLWKGDCLQLQIGASLVAERYELGFALSQFGGTRRLGHVWEPIAKDLIANGPTTMTASSNQDVIFYVGRDDKKKLTTYEVAFKFSYFGAASQGKVGGKIPFAYVSHLYQKGTSDADNHGYFLEWADGVVGNAETKDLSIAAMITFAAANKSPNAYLGGGSTPTTAKTTAKKTTATTKKPTTTKNGGNTPGTTKPNQPVTQKPGETTAKVTTTTTTTTAPQEKGTEFYDAEKAIAVENEDILGKFAEEYPDMELAVESVTVAEDKFGIFPSETFKGLYKKDGDNFVKLEGVEETFTAEDGSESTWLIYEVGKGTEIYAVNEVLPTEPEVTEADVTTAASTETKATTTTAAAEESEGGLSIIWIIVIIVAVLAIAAAVVFFLLKKKKNGGDTSADV